MIYLIRSYGEGGKSILKVGFSDNLQYRLDQYFYHNPLFKVLETREGDEVHESLLHEYLNTLGYSFTVDGKLNEWFEDNQEVIDIFKLSLEDLSDKVWEIRDKVFGSRKFDISSRKNYTYRLFEFLYNSHKDTFYPEEFIVIDGDVIKKIDNYREVDKVFFEIHNSLNSSEIELPDTYSKENIEIASEFLDNYFYQTGIFEEKMKMYCEFCDYYSDNLEVMDILNHRITNPRFKQFYDYFGTSGCSSRKFREKNLLESWGNDSKEEMLVKEIYMTFNVGEKYSMKELKSKVQEIYQKLGITKTPKATDLGKYFTLKKTKVTLPDKTIVHGFKLESL